MRRLIAVVIAVTAFAAAGPTAALAGSGNPNGTGQPGQSCQDVVAGGGTEPSGNSGGAVTSPGSPFNEPSSTSSGGTGGAHYNATNSQYDVACYQVSQH
jgi:hypothetical protein